MSDLDLAPLQSALTAYAPLGRSALLPALNWAQAHYGHVPETVAAEIGRVLGVPLADVHGAIEFYAMLYNEPVGHTVVRICTDPACALRGADDLLAAAQSRVGGAETDISPDGALTVEPSPCLGLCNVAVAVNVSHAVPTGGTSWTRSFAPVTPDTLDDAIRGVGPTPTDHIGGDLDLITALCREGRAASLTEYEAAGGMQAARRALSGDLSPAAIIDLVKRSGLVGRGGAAFPTGVKWEAAARAPGAPKYVVVNADESEPGTFKDRILMEGDPHRILEGALLCAYAIGANYAYIYIRGEYPTAAERIRHAITEARERGYLGPNILGSGFDLDIEVRIGAGAYICGEETALLESIEGNRGFPRVKPPFPVTHGLFGQPTVINNVETLAKVPFILVHGPDRFREFGTPSSTGPKLFCVSGDVARPGLYEVPFGVTLRHLVDDLAGGVTGGSRQAMLVGGAAGAFATPDHLDVKLTVEDLRAAGLALGSAAVMVFNDTRDLGDLLVRLARFFAHESCGKCYPCQLGTQRQLEVLERVAAGHPTPGDVDRLTDVGWTMTESSLCGLGQTAAIAVLSAIRLWPDRFRPNGAQPPTHGPNGGQ